MSGAIIGDTIGFWVGHRFGPRILDSRLGRVVKQEHRRRAERYLAERGGKAVFLGRFTAALRALIPGFAGMARKPYRTFGARPLTPDYPPFTPALWWHGASYA